MPKPNFEFIGDEDRGRLRIVVRNHWDLAVFEQFKAEEQLWSRRIARDNGRYPYRYLLIDASEHGVQSQDVIKALRSLIESRQKVFVRTAIVIAGALHQMQAGRVRANSDHHRLCTSVEEALIWLSPGIQKGQGQRGCNTGSEMI